MDINFFELSEKFEAWLNKALEWFINDSGALNHFPLETWKNIGIGVVFSVAFILLVSGAYRAWKKDMKEEDQNTPTTPTQPTQTAPAQPAAEPAQPETDKESERYTKLTYYPGKFSPTGLWEEEVGVPLERILKGVYVYQKASTPEEIGRSNALFTNAGEKWLYFRRSKSSPSDFSQIREFEVQAGIKPPRTARENGAAGGKLSEQLSTIIQDAKETGVEVKKLKPQGRKLGPLEFRWGGCTLDILPESKGWYDVELSKYDIKLSTDEEGMTQHHPYLDRDLKQVFRFIAKYKESDMRITDDEGNIIKEDTNNPYLLFEYIPSDQESKRRIYLWEGDLVEDEEIILEVLELHSPGAAAAKRKKLQEAKEEALRLEREEEEKAQKAQIEKEKKERQEKNAARRKKIGNQLATFFKGTRDMVVKLFTTIKTKKDRD